MKENTSSSSSAPSPQPTSSPTTTAVEVKVDISPSSEPVLTSSTHQHQQEGEQSPQTAVQFSDHRTTVEEHHQEKGESESLQNPMTSKLVMHEDLGEEKKRELDLKHSKEIQEANKHILKRNTFEYLVAISYIFVSIYIMFNIANGMTERFQGKYRRQHHIHKPWTIFAGSSVGIDNTDGQLRDFMANIGLLGPAFLAFAGIGNLFRHMNLNEQIPHYYIATGIMFVSYLHGARCFFMFLIMLGNYFLIAKLHDKIPYKLYQLIIWVVHIGILFMNEKNDGYNFASVHPSLAYLQEKGGVLRWHVIFNMTTLRMIAYNYDVWEARFHGPETREKVEKKHKASCVDCAVIDGPCYKLRTDAPHSSIAKDYGLVHYMAYMLYIPLFVGGPMSSFNGFVSHMKQRQLSFNLKKCLHYAAHLLGLYLCLMFMLHHIHLNAIKDNDDLFSQLAPVEKGVMMYLMLAFLWLKFSVLWKFFRFIAIIDGVEAPEDMRRCFSNTVTVQSFWRDWHASFNAWIVRYMYIPLGGSKSRLWSIFPIFGFIALWHDISMNLFMWAFVMCIAFVPEILVTSFFYGPRFKKHHAQWYWRYIRAVGGTCGIVSLIFANLVGFGTGNQNTKDGFGTLMTREAGITTAIGMVFFFCAATLGIRDRDAEADQHRKLKLQYGLV